MIRNITLKFINVYQSILNTYLQVVMLPASVRIKNIYMSLFLLMIIIFTLTLITNLINKISNYIIYSNIYTLCLMCSIIYLCFISYNIVIRIYNIYIRSLIYFIKNNTIISSKIICMYYIYNTLAIIITILFTFRLYSILENNNNYNISLVRVLFYKVYFIIKY